MTRAITEIVISAVLILGPGGVERECAKGESTLASRKAQEAMKLLK